MKMVIKVELFFLVEGENLSAKDVKVNLEKRCRQVIKEGMDASPLPNFNTIPKSFSVVNLDGSKSKAVLTVLTEDEAYDQLR
jgi:hypothetical protein